MLTSENINEIAKAISLAQALMKPAEKDSENPHFRSRYADLSSSWQSIRKPITDNGLSILQDVTTTDSGISISTRIIHVSGQWIEFGPLYIPSFKKDAQGFGSAITYGKRYALCAAMGIVADDDDDGNEASEPSHRTAPAKKYTAPSYDADPAEMPYKPDPTLTIAQALELEQLIEGDEEITKSLFTNYGVDSFSKLKEKNFEYIKGRINFLKGKKVRESA